MPVALLVPHSLSPAAPALDNANVVYKCAVFSSRGLKGMLVAYC